MKDKRYSLLLIGLVLILASSVVACNQTPTTTPPAPPQQAPKTQTTSSPAASPSETAAIQPTPRTLIETGPAIQLEADANNFVIPLTVGDKVELAVSIPDGFGKSSSITDPWGNSVNTPNVSNKFSAISTITDPFGNIVGQSKTKVDVESTPRGNITRTFSSQDYPWRFAFIAATTGNYLLRVNTLTRFQPVNEVAHLDMTLNAPSTLVVVPMTTVPPPPEPTEVPGPTLALLSPANGATNVSVRPVFAWYDIPGATKYRLEVVGYSPGYGEKFRYGQGVLGETSKAYILLPLSYGTEYSWTVTASPQGERFPVGTFTTEPEPPEITVTVATKP